jgi:hypothetical protein
MKAFEEHKNCRRIVGESILLLEQLPCNDIQVLVNNIAGNSCPSRMAKSFLAQLLLDQCFCNRLMSANVPRVDTIADDFVDGNGKESLLVHVSKCKQSVSVEPKQHEAVANEFGNDTMADDVVAALHMEP